MDLRCGEEGGGAAARNWMDLPRDVAEMILRRLGVVDLLTSAQFVCTKWRRICRDPSMWRHVDMFIRKDFDDPLDYAGLCRLAVDLSQGGLISIAIDHFAEDDLLLYIAHRSSHLKHLKLINCYDVSDETFILVAANVPLLEELEFSFCNPSVETIEVFGRCCPLIKTFKLNSMDAPLQNFAIRGPENDKEALTIAKTMPGLVHLQIFGNLLTNAGLEAIMDACPHLESLDLRECFNLDLSGQLGKTCAERIRVLKLHPTDGYPCTSEVAYLDGSEYSDSDDLYGTLSLPSDYEYATMGSGTHDDRRQLILQPEEGGGTARNWMELPCDVAEMILRRLGVVDMLTSAQYVCTRWRRICRDPSMWRHVDMFIAKDPDDPLDYARLCRLAVDLSQGGLVGIIIDHFAEDDLLLYIADRSSQLKHLNLASCYNMSEEALASVAAKVPLLEELEFSYCKPSLETIEVFGRCCPLLKTFKLNSGGVVCRGFQNDEEALTIAKSMPGLVHLQIFGNLLTNTGLEAILNDCPHLESLDLRQCFNLDLSGQLGKSCAERIRDLKLPFDSTDGYPFTSEVAYLDEYGYSDSDGSLDYAYDDYADDYDDFSEDIGGFDQFDYWFPGI